MNAHDMVKCLNELREKDPACITRLFLTRYPLASADIRDSVFIHAVTVKGAPALGILGVLNGMLLASGSPDVITMIVDDEPTQVLRFDVDNYEKLCKPPVDDEPAPTTSGQ